MTFCAEPPQLRTLLGVVVGMPVGVAAGYFTHRLGSRLKSNGWVMRHLRRFCVILATLGVVSSSMVIIGGPCVFAGSGRGGGSYSNDPTTLGHALKVVWLVAIPLAGFFTLVLSGRHRRSGH